jgi:hypothetical protein
MEQLEGFSQPGQEHLVCKLKSHFMGSSSLQGSGTSDLTPT